jgi:hypothetical protein
MAIVPLPLSQDVQARALLQHLLEHGDIVGRDAAGRTIVQLAVDDRVLETLLIFDADAPSSSRNPTRRRMVPVVVEPVRPKVVERRRVIPLDRVD